MGLLNLHLGLAIERQNDQVKHYVSSSLFHHCSRVFISFQNKTQRFLCMTLSSLSIYVVFVDPHKGNNDVMPFLFLQLKLMWSLCVGRKLEHTCNAYIVKSNNGFKESWVIQSNQDVHVCGCMVDIYGG